MLLLKGFFRKKSTIVYIILYSIIFFTLLIVSSLIKYNETYLNSIYQKSSFLILTSSEDCYDEIEKNKNVEKVDRFIMFEPYDECTIFKHQSYSVVTNNYTIDYNAESQQDDRIAWEDFMALGGIMIFSDKNKNFKLNNNEIALSSSGIEYVKQEIKNNLIGQDLSFSYNNEIHTFTIKNYYNSVNSEMTISEEKFNELKNFSEYSYKLYIQDYLNLGDSIAELKKSINNGNVEVDGIQNAYLGEEADKYYQSKDLLYLYELICFFTIITFIIIFIIVSRNVLKDEKKNIKIERMLGYNKLQSRKIGLLNILVLNFSALFISIIFFIIISVGINIFTDYTIPIFSFKW